MYTYSDKYNNFYISKYINVAIKKKKTKIKLDLELDKLDNSLIKIIKKRTNLVKKVLALKEKKNQIVDQKRIRLNIKEYKKKSLKIILIQKSQIVYGKI